APPPAPVLAPPVRVPENPGNHRVLPEGPRGSEERRGAAPPERRERQGQEDNRPDAQRQQRQ
ncbi:MAG TPA: hypothetical protein VE029_14260, partial [Rhizobacter sp.]|nr:hypothetical protein [Rhizobacter sp.]